MKTIVERFSGLIDIIVLPFIYPAAAVMRLAREVGCSVSRSPEGRSAKSA